ncbi:hypothetical protein EYF80_052702 [Liparis tanakae]|uniref:Uncharacterized protein n=1 Tax=Liparis tanakae TaxID=230148 RepID=A0A4Z2F8C3_9TELE|nr:hypothetical protein EYF80_052702 [Liparis tanakae]
MCRHADPVGLSRIGPPASFQSLCLARRGVDYICMVQRSAFQLTRGINGEGNTRGRGGGGGGGEEEEERGKSVSA